MKKVASLLAMIPVKEQTPLRWLRFNLPLAFTGVGSRRRQLAASVKVTAAATVATS